MSENYTAEDFAQANLATRGEFGVARRTDPRDTHQWYAYGGEPGWFSDEEMAADGWTPVVESRVTEHTLRDPQEKAARKREKLVDHIADQDRVIRRRNDEITALRLELADLRRENRRLDAEADGAVSLDGLEAAWESAEQAEECRKGDVLIIRDDEDNYLVRRMDDRSDLDSTARILSRAPREPWADLADIIGRYDGDTDDPAGLARFLHENEVTTPFDHDAGRVTGGGE